MHRYQKGPLDDRNGCDIADEIEIEVVIEGRIDRGSSIRTKERIAIGRRTDDGLGGDIAGGATPVLDDEWLTEPLRERLTHQAYEDVRSAARGISNDAAHWPRRIGLRPCYPRHRWQRDSASGQMQEFAAGKFHDVPPGSRRVRVRVDAQRVADEGNMPADSTSAAHCNDRDFDTSRWQLR